MPTQPVGRSPDHNRRAPTSEAGRRRFGSEGIASENFPCRGAGAGEREQTARAGRGIRREEPVAIGTEADSFEKYVKLK